MEYILKAGLTVLNDGLGCRGKKKKKRKKSQGFVGALGKCRCHSIYCYGILTKGTRVLPEGVTTSNLYVTVCKLRVKYLVDCI